MAVMAVMAVVVAVEVMAVDSGCGRVGGVNGSCRAGP